MAGGLTIFVMLWYLWKRNHGYVGPHVLLNADNEVLKGNVGIVYARTARRESLIGNFARRESTHSKRSG